jgi:hypothetical protein
MASRRLKTSIPMSSEEQQLATDYENACFLSGDSAGEEEFVVSPCFST